MAQIASENLVIGRGQLQFSKFVVANPTTPRAAEYRDLGNCPGVTLNVTTETKKHNSSRGGLRLLDLEITLSQEFTGTITVEDMKPENFARFLMGTESTLSQAAVASATETFTNVKVNSGYQLGVSLPSRPEGYKNVTITTAVLAAAPATPLVDGLDYEFDGPRGFFRILPTTDKIVDSHLSTGFTLTYAVGAHTRSRVVSGSTELRGSLQYHAYNYTGPVQDFFFPNVTLRPNGDLGLITDEDFMTLNFGFTAAPLGNVPAVLLNGQPVV